MREGCSLFWSGVTGATGSWLWCVLLSAFIILSVCYLKTCRNLFHKPGVELANILKHFDHPAGAFDGHSLVYSGG